MTHMESEFWEFHNAHPSVLEALATLLHDWLVRHPRGRTSARQLIDRLRWDADEHSIRLNNNFGAFYARVLIEKYPEFNDVLVIRHQISMNKDQEP